MDYKLRKAEPRDVSDILRLVKVDDHKPVNIYNIGLARITYGGSYDREGLSRPRCGTVMKPDFQIWPSSGFERDLDRGRQVLCLIQSWQ